MRRPSLSPHFAIRRKVMAGFLAAFALLLIVAFFSYRSTKAYLESVRSVAETRRIFEEKEGLLRSLYEVESGARGYAASGSEDFLRLYEGAQSGVVYALNRLKRMVESDPVQRRRLETVKPLVARKMSFLKDGVDIRHSDSPEEVAAHFGQTSDIELMDQIRSIMEEFDDALAQELDARTQEATRASRIAGVVVAGGPVAGFLLLMAALVVILRDISSRRRAEEELARQHSLLTSVIDAIPDLIFVKDRNGRYIIDNRAHREVLRVQGLQDVEGRTAEDFHAPELARQFRREDEYVVSTGIPILNRERAQLDEDGRTDWFSTTKVPLRGPGGEIAGVVCITSDITERRAAEEQLRLTAARLERSNGELQEFASVASHDLQEPLRKILAFSDRLQMKCGAALGDTGRDYLERVMSAARRMQTLIQDLLTLARVTSRAQPFVPTDLGRIVREVLEDLEWRIEQTRATVEVGSLPTVEADPLQMRQLFQNLLANALKFARPGTQPRVEIQAAPVPVLGPPSPGPEAEAPVEAWQIVVRDHGIGFDQRFAERIFQVFQRLHGRTEYEGTGIGLAVVRKIVDRHNGAIAAKSTDGEGASFIVTLPTTQPIGNTPDETR